MTSRRTLLVVDDTPANLTLITAVLKDAYTLVVATRGAKALSLVEERQPALILLDIDMPEMDGYEVCRRLKASPDTAHIPVIFLTARSEVADEAMGFELGAADYIHKPFSPAIVRARVATQLALADALATAELERRRADDLLDSVLPKQIADELRASGTVAARAHERTALIFCDVVGFTSWCDRHPPEAVITRLDALFRAFDHVADLHGVTKIKTLGDGFMGAVGVLSDVDDPLGVALACARDLVRVTPTVASDWTVRVGVHAGPAISGIAGRSGYQFDVWGDTVNVASRLCSAALPGTVATLAIQAPPHLTPFWRGSAALKGKGEVEIALFRDAGPAAMAEAE